MQVLQARGTFVDSTNLSLEYTGGKSGDTTLTFEHCIVATGSSPSRIPALDLPSERVMDSTGALELPDIPESLLVIGGGYIGLEMGTVYAELGSKVTVVEMTGGLLPGVDRDLVKPLEARMKKRFDAIYLDTKVAKLVDRGDSIEAVFDGSDSAPPSRFDRVLLSVGRRPNSRGIGLEATQVVVNDRGFIEVDNRMRSTDPHILAIGDVVGEPMLAHKASHEGKVAVEALAGGPAAFEPMAIPAVVFTDPEIAWAGLTDAQAKQQGREVEVAKYPWAASGRAQSLARTEGLTKLLFDPHDDRLLGAGIVGPGAGELIGECVLAIEMGCTVRDLTETIHPHPTLSETIGFAAEVHLGLATEVYRPKRSRATV